MKNNNELARLREELEVLESRASELEANDNEEEYDDMLNDVYGDVTVAGMQYSTARVLAEVDPTAYRCGHSDFNDSLLTDVNEEIEAKKREIDELE